ncbi:RNA polymerase II-associated protein [Candidatus Electronema sp. PJ]|uniref:RNA polymerase II-associated protein n=1 Tax=Candidatus Electronema sp. PJ TaxID=3401572 RepID=UPI003AA7F4F3
MELECTKYKEKMDAAQALCKHPHDYCQYRQSCLIQFLEREKRGKPAADASDAEKKK